MEKLLGAYIYLCKRMKEPSSHAAMSSLFLMAGLNIDTGWIHDLSVLISMVFGASGFFLKEAKPLTNI